MTAISATKARDNIYQLISDVNANCQPITITNNKGRNAVLIGEEDWRAIEETLFLMRSKDIPLEVCAENMNVSTKTIDRLHKKVKDKVGRIINEVHKGGLTKAETESPC